MQDNRKQIACCRNAGLYIVLFFSHYDVYHLGCQIVKFIQYLGKLKFQIEEKGFNTMHFILFLLIIVILFWL